MNKVLIGSGFLGFSAIALGAYGDHGLRGSIDDAAMRSFETALRYQLFHAIALLAIGMGMATTLPAQMLKRLSLAGFIILIGTCVFSGSIYASVFLTIEFITMLTPLGGITLMAGWLTLMFCGLKTTEQKTGVKL
ncbi:MAG: hypothetical protein CMH27_06995 [Micavibrio sp.]|nr:hypothetical protein [Micavibrio sp.]|tara:strand:- start:1040 stop:1444 length:405 start_codon:yes stop_codon:yes gene_type:complete